jgi:hypothetical protein
VSHILDRALDASRATDCAMNDQALLQMPWFRVSGDWPGGGFGYTLPFNDAAAAEAWGKRKARFHHNAVITVTPRGTWPTDRQQLTAPQKCIAP